MVNEDPNGKLIRELREELDRLRAEVGSGGGGGGAGGVNEFANFELQTQLAETEEMLASMNQSWESKLAQSQSVINSHKEMLDSHGASVGPFPRFVVSRVAGAMLLFLFPRCECTP